MKRQRVRKAVTLISFLLFPIVMNFLSPYLIIAGASEGVIAGCFIFFLLLFAGSLVLGRAYCGWVCPAAALQEACFAVNDKRVCGRRLDWIKYLIWFPWVTAVIAAAISAGGFKKIDLLYMTETGISVDSPSKYIVYFSVMLIFVVLSFVSGRRASCHCICWMAPFMIFGRKIRKLTGGPMLRLRVEAGKCTNCKQCEKKCPMSLEVNSMVNSGSMENNECILCGECVDTCPRHVIQYSFK